MSISLNGSTLSNSAVGSGNSVNGWSSPPAAPKTIQDNVWVVVFAKDNERDHVKPLLESFGYEITNAPFSLPPTFRTEARLVGDKRVVIVELDCQGPAAVRQFEKLLKSLPYSCKLFTSGICGGRTEDLGKVLFFRNILYQGRHEIVDNGSGAATATWREDRDLVLEPRVRNKLFTAHIEAPDELTAEQLRKKLDSVVVGQGTADAVDMEIGGFIKACQRWNAHAAAAKQHVFYMSLKVVSDDGPKATRKQQEADGAIYEALVSVLVKYLANL